MSIAPEPNPAYVEYYRRAVAPSYERDYRRVGDHPYHSGFLQAVACPWTCWRVECCGGQEVSEEGLEELYRLMNVYFELEGRGKYPRYYGEYPVLCRLPK